MAVISEKHISDISQKLGESKFFLDIRKKVLSTLPEDKKKYLQYGHGIGIDGSEFFSDIKKKTQKYTVENKGKATILTWSDWCRDEIYEKEIYEGLESSYASFTKNIVAAGAAASFSDGKVIVCPGGKETEVVFTTDCMGANDIVFVIAQSDAHLTIFDTIQSTGAAGGRTVIIVAKKGAIVKYIQTHQGKEALYNNVIYFARKGAHILYTGVSLSCGALMKTDVDHYLEGEGACSEIQNVSLSSRSGIVDMNSVVYHRASHTRSYILASGVAADKSKTVYKSDILMQKDTCGIVTGDQKATFLLLSPKAEIDAIPALNIAQKEVRCSHSVSVSHVKESDLYYPQLRGLKKSEASRMIVEGMLQSGLQDMEQDVFAHTLRKKIQDALVKIDF